MTTELSQNEKNALATIEAKHWRAVTADDETVVEILKRKQSILETNARIARGEVDLGAAWVERSETTLARDTDRLAELGVA